MKGRTTVGVLGSIVWLAGVTSLLMWKCNQIAGLTLADWGNFIAGASSGLALLWLVLGYVQQAEELRLNTKALELQAKELQHQVAETKALVLQSQAQAESSRELLELEKTRHRQAIAEARIRARPRLVGRGGSSPGDRHEYTFINAGAAVRKLHLTCDDPSATLRPTDHLESGGTGQITCSASVAFPLAVSLEYEDGLGLDDAMLIELRPRANLVLLGYASEKLATG